MLVPAQGSLGTVSEVNGVSSSNLFQSHEKNQDFNVWGVSCKTLTIQKRVFLCLMLEFLFDGLWYLGEALSAQVGNFHSSYLYLHTSLHTLQILLGTWIIL